MQHANPRALETKSAILETKEAPGEDPGADVEKAVADLTAAFESKMTGFEAELKAEKARADRLETILNRPGGGNADNDNDKVERKAFVAFTRRGAESLADVERKALRVADNTAGGYLAPDDFVAEMLRDLVEFSPVRSAARVGSTASGAVILPRRTGITNAQWVGETEDRSDSEPSFGQIEIPVHEIATYTDISNQLLEDAAVDIEAELRLAFAEDFGTKEGAAFIAGDGIKKPLGLLADDDLPYTANVSTSAIDADKLIDLFYAVKAGYRNQAAWMMNGATLAAIRKLKDGENNYLWRPGLAEGQPETILGRPVVEAPDMPNIEAQAEPIIFGDFARGYRIYDRINLSVLRDPYSVGTKGLVRFHARRRVGGRVTKAEALRKLRMSST